MKKVLFASTALVAAGLMTASAASASEKIKLNLGGFSKWWVVGAWQDDAFTRASNAAGAGNNQADYANVDIKGDNEIFFGGSTTLDNGMKVGVQIEMEAGGHADTTTGPNSRADMIDESYVFIETGYGKFIVGSENNGTYLLHVNAPDAAGNWGEGGIMTGNTAIAKPAQVSAMGIAAIAGNNVTAANTTAIVTDGDADKITYVAPTFYGLTLGGSYVPNAVDEDNRAVSTAVEAYGVGALYANTFAGVGVKVSAGWVTYDGGTPYGSSDEYSTGAQLSYAGFTLGGSYRNVNEDQTGSLNPQGNVANSSTTVSSDGEAWDLGLQYASGPYAISIAYFQSKVDGLVADADEDTITAYQVSGKYTLGAGVDLLATVGHIEYEDEGTNAGAGAANHNDGWTVMTGMGLTF